MKVAVVQGGPTSEAEVSRSSARSVARALEAAGHVVTRLELDAALPEALRAGGFDVVFPITHARSARTARSRACSRCSTCRTSARTCSRARSR